MKYTNFGRELPPLGEFVAVKTDKESISINLNFICRWHGEEKRESTEIQHIRSANGDDFCFLGNGKNIKWAKLPTFRSLSKEKPPTGVSVLFKSECEESDFAEHYHVGFLRKDANLSFHHEGLIYKVTGWLPLDIFDEDPCPCVPAK